MGRIARPSTDTAQRDELRLRSLDRKSTAASATASTSGSRGVQAFARSATGPVTTTATTQAGAAAVVATQATLEPLRRYRVEGPDIGVYGPAGALALLQITYTVDGSAPTPSSPRLKQTTIDTSGSTRGRTITGYLTTDRAEVVLRALLSFYGLSAGSYTVVDQADWPALLLIEDVGPA